jgi:hypothetical protein
MVHYSSELAVAAGIFNLMLALFHMAFWRLFQWPGSLGSLGQVNRRILYVLNLAVTALFVLLGYLLIVHASEFASTHLGPALLWGLALFWLLRAALQPPLFGLTKPLSMGLFLVFLLGSALHGLAAWSSGVT